MDFLSNNNNNTLVNNNTKLLRWSIFLNIHYNSLVLVVQGSRRRSVLTSSELESQRQARIYKAERRLQVLFSVDVCGSLCVRENYPRQVPRGRLYFILSVCLSVRVQDYSK